MIVTVLWLLLGLRLQSPLESSEKIKIMTLKPVVLLSKGAEGILEQNLGSSTGVQELLCSPGIILANCACA